MTLQELRTAAVDHHKKGDLAPAKRLYARYLAMVPNDYLMWSNLGALFRTEKQFDLSVAAHYRALEGPQSSQIIGNASNAFFDAGLAKEAVQLREGMLKTEPDNASHPAMLAKFLRGAGKYKKAERITKQAIKTFPDDPELHIQLAMAQLSLGDYPNGFEQFDWRWKGDEISLPEMKYPRWQGEALMNRTLLIMPEQGFGDTILMARFIKEIKAMGGTVYLMCKEPLRRLFANLDGVDRLIGPKDTFDAPDFWAPIMDLPRYLGTRIDALPSPANLSAPKAAQERAAAILAPHSDRLKVGVLWSGSVTYRANHKRSFDHRKYLALADIPNMQMFSLYKGPLHKNFATDGTSAIIVDAAGSDADFADSAALIQGLDLVITMDSAIAHVAGSLGRPVWNLLHSEAYWLYEPYSEKTPWYPNMRLIRQKKSGEWDRVFDRLRTDVAKLAVQFRKDKEK